MTATAQPSPRRVSSTSTRLLLLVALSVGVVVRLRQYVVGRSLWNDEAALALNILARDTAGLFRPLDYLQGAPIGYLLLLKLSTAIAGPGELALRAVALIAGILALLLFAVVARRLVGATAGALAVLLLAAAPLHIYYSNEVKQYALDVLMTVLALALFLFMRRGLTPARTIIAAAAGALMLWLSHPAVFTLSAVGLVALVEAWRRGEARQTRRLVFIGAIWGATFLGLALFSLTELTANAALAEFWRGGFMPPLYQPLELIGWAWVKLTSLTEFMLGLSAVALPAAAAGIAVLARRDRALLAVLLLPIGLLLMAAALNRYPFADRLLLFTTPLVALLVSVGTVELIRLVRPLGRFPAYALAALMLLPALLQTAELLREPQYKEELRPVLAHIVSSRQQNDRILLYYGSALAFEYYRPTLGLDAEKVTMLEGSRDSWTPYFRALDEAVAGGGRTWLIFSHVYTEAGANEEALLINYLYQLGFPALDVRLEPGASAYLFDFS